MSFLEKLQDIDTFIFDVDGIFTDGTMLITENGDYLRSMNTKDGFAVKYAIQQGYKVIIITGGSSKGVVTRFKRLGVEDIFDGIENKIDVLRQQVDLFGLDLGKTLYMGDDIPDYECMRWVHLPACPCDAVHEIQEVAQYISPFAGGKGCVRDVIEKVLRVHDKWAAANTKTNFN